MAEQISERILIVTGGRIEDGFVLDLLDTKAYTYVIACDKGMEFFYRTGRHPNLIVGDFDSANAECVDYFNRQSDVVIRQFPAKKDWTDTELAFRIALEYHPAHIDMVGATGSRLDHVLGNLQILKAGCDVGVEISLLDAHNRVRLIDEPLTIKKEEQYGDFVSVLPFGGKATLTLQGMKYPLDHALLLPGVTLGISNEIMTACARILPEYGQLLVIESRD